MTSYLSLQITLEQQNAFNNLVENYNPETLYFQLSSRIIFQHEMNILRQQQQQEQQQQHQQNDEEHQQEYEADTLEEQLRDLVKKAPKGFSKFHRIGPLSLFSQHQQQENNNNNISKNSSLSCAIPLLYDRNKEQKQPSTASLENLLFKIELVQIIKNAETGKLEENLLGQPVMTWRQFPSTFLLTTSSPDNNNKNKNNN